MNNDIKSGVGYIIPLVAVIGFFTALFLGEYLLSVFVGHSEAINIEFEDFLDEDEARDILREAPGVMVIDKRDDGGYVTPIECAGDYATFISRLRQDSTIENGLNLWCVSDNLRKGAALNAVQIAETLGQRVLKKG